MTEQVGAVQPQVATQKKDNAVRNSAIAGGTGLIAGGAAGYATKQIMKNNEFTDEFIKEVKNQIINDNWDKDSAKAIKAQLKMKENPSIEAIKSYLKKHAAAEFGDNAAEELATLFSRPDDHIRTFFSKSLADIKEELKTELDPIITNLKSYLEDGKKLFTKQEQFKDNDIYKSILKAQHEVKGKAGLIWGAATGAVLGTGVFIASKMSGKKEA